MSPKESGKRKSDLADGTHDRRERLAGELSREALDDLDVTTADRSDVTVKHAQRVSAWTGHPVDPMARPSIDEAEAKRCRTWTVTAMVLLGVEGTFASYTATRLLTLPTPIGIGLGLIITIAQALLWKAILAIFDDPSRPNRSARRTQQVALAASLLSIALLAALLAIRLTEEADMLLSDILTAAGIALPVAAAALLQLAHQYDDRNRLARTFNRLDDEIHATERFIEWLNGWSRPAAALPPPQEPTEPKRAARGNLVAMLLAGMLLGSGIAHADVGKLRILRDVSGSPDVETMSNIASALVASPEGFVGALPNVREIEVVRWAAAKEVWATGRAFSVPRRPIAPLDDREPEEPSSLFKRVDDKRRAEERARIAAEREKMERDYRNTMADVFHSLADALNQASNPKSASTCVRDALTRGLQADDHILTIIITDGIQENCGRLSTMDAGSNDNVVLILVPSARDGNSMIAKTNERAAALLKIAPSVRVLPWHRVAPNWSWLRGTESTAMDSTKVGAEPRAIVTAAAGATSRLLQPHDGERVSMIAMARGLVASPGQSVQVLVRPVEEGAHWWVQRTGVPIGDGRWEAPLQFGTNQGAGIGESFEVVAVELAPDGAMPTGHKLPHAMLLTLLESVPHSSVITVRRTE
jgi:hypothetical protein